MTDNSQQFASDNYSGICPEAWAAMEKANLGHERAYGDDQWTERAAEYFRELFETDCEVFFAFNGTAANSLALASCARATTASSAPRPPTSRPTSAVRRSSSPTAPSCSPHAV